MTIDKTTIALCMNKQTDEQIDMTSARLNTFLFS